MFDWNYTKDRTNIYKMMYMNTACSFFCALFSTEPKYIVMATFYSRCYHYNPQIFLQHTISQDSKYLCRQMPVS